MAEIGEFSNSSGDRDRNVRTCAWTRSAIILPDVCRSSAVTTWVATGSEESASNRRLTASSPEPVSDADQPTGMTTASGSVPPRTRALAGSVALKTKSPSL